MSKPLTIEPCPPPPAPAPLVAVDRAIAELRRGGTVRLVAEGQAVLVVAAEGVTAEKLDQLRDQADPPVMVITGRRAEVLRLTEAATGPVVVSAKSGIEPEMVRLLADPAYGNAGRLPDGHALHPAAPTGIEAGAVALAKLARLLPAAVIAPLAKDAPAGLVSVELAEVLGYQQTAARTLRIVSEARVPLELAENARIVAFRPSDGGIEHLAIVIGEPDLDQPVLTRLHSECFTGDLLGSLRCDCGDQLRGAIGEIAGAGAGVLLYLSQEGRGIGLVNKLRAYRLQDLGFDTMDANGQLGFDDDERLYMPAAEILRQLGVTRVRLLTNNPFKVEALARSGVEVTERVPHVFPSNDHNAGYLRTKAVRGGHLF